jgi:hypothetical protein
MANNVEGRSWSLLIEKEAIELGELFFKKPQNSVALVC